MKSKKITSLVLTLVFALCGVMFFVPTNANPTNVYASSQETEFFFSDAISDDSISIGGGGNASIQMFTGTFHETIQYHTRQVDTYIIPTRLPSYISGFGCGPTGGGLIVSYYNIANPNLIAGHLAGIWHNGAWLWNGQTAAINNMFAEVNQRMGGGPGVTQVQYWIGLSLYSHARGLGISIDSHCNGANAVSPSFFTTIQSGIPITLFFNGYNFSNRVEQNGQDNISISTYSGTHIMIAYGYEVVTYRNANNQIFRQDTYLRVHSGLSAGLTTMRINSHCTLVHADSIHIA